jgi:DNA-binding SARP family transcriptional activator
MALEVKLLGDTHFAFAGSSMGASDLPGPIGRHILTRLAIDPFPIGRERLVDDIWGASPPRAVDSVLSATLSRLRNALSRIGLDGRALIVANAGSVNFVRPKGTEVDVELAHHHIDFALRDLRSGDVREAHRRATISYSISRRPLLTGFERDWLDIERDRMYHVERRSLGLLCEVARLAGRLEEAIQLGREHVRIAPYDEGAHRDLIVTLKAAGNHSGAVKVEADFRERLRDDLGVAASADFTSAVAPAG